MGADLSALLTHVSLQCSHNDVCAGKGMDAFVRWDLHPTRVADVRFIWSMSTCLIVPHLFLWLFCCCSLLVLVYFCSSTFEVKPQAFHCKMNCAAHKTLDVLVSQTACFLLQIPTRLCVCVWAPRWPGQSLGLYQPWVSTTIAQDFSADLPKDRYLLYSL